MQVSAACGSSLAGRRDVPLLFLMQSGRGPFHWEEESEEALAAISAPTLSSRKTRQSKGMSEHEVLGPHVVLGRGTKVFVQTSSRLSAFTWDDHCSTTDYSVSG